MSAFSAAEKVLVGGVNSPVRAFKAVGGEPVFIERAKDAYLYSNDDRKFIDYVGSWGPMILGHANDKVIDAVCQAAQHGLSFGAPSELETQAAELVCEALPMAEKVRFVSSGTEATMSAIRLIRGITGRDKIIKFEGCYHGHVDALLVKAGSGALTLGTPTSPGIPESFSAHTLVADFNDIDHVRALFEKHGKDIAGIIVEPIAGNMNMIFPKAGFLEGLRSLCDDYGSLLIFDEVMTGFRVAHGGAQAVYGVKPDITALGKIIGGGMPVGAIAGPALLMDHFAPLGPVYQAGTLSGNPVAMSAGIATLSQLRQSDFYQTLEAKCMALVDGLNRAAEKAGVPFFAQGKGGMFGMFFTDKASVTSYDEVTACREDHFTAFFNGMLERGVYLAPSAYEAGFISQAHSSSDIEETVEKAYETFSALSV